MLLTEVEVVNGSDTFVHIEMTIYFENTAGSNLTYF